MYFATFMSIEDWNELLYKGKFVKTRTDFDSIKQFGKSLGYVPIFCIPIEIMKETLFKFVFTSCNAPQKLVVFRSNRIKYIEFVNWMNYVNGYESNVRVLPFKTKNYCEGIVDYIILDEVVEKYDISCRPLISSGYTSSELTCHDDWLGFVFSKKLNKILTKFCDNKESKSYYLKDIMKVSLDEQQEFMYLNMKLNMGRDKINENDINAIRDFVYNKLIKNK